MISQRPYKLWHIDRENNIRVGNIRKGWLKLNHPFHLKEMSQITWLKNKGKASKPKRYRGKKTQTKTKGRELEANTKSKGWCSYLEGHVLDIGPRALDKYERTMQELERYLGATYSNSSQLAITNEKPDTFPNPYMQTIIPGTGVERPKTDVEMTYLKKRVLTSPHIKNWGIRMFTKQTCTTSTILL